MPNDWEAKKYESLYRQVRWTAYNKIVYSCTVDINQSMQNI